MDAREQKWREFVANYDIEVPKSAIDNELAYIELQMKHNMQYDRLSGGSPHLFPQRELDTQADEILAAAIFEAKAPRVVKDVAAKQGFTVTRAELETEAEALAARQNSTLEMVRRFFGDDFAMLERDLLERKVIDWACGQMG